MLETFCRDPLLTPELKRPFVEGGIRTRILDDRSLDALLRIEKILCVLEPMGSDSCRYLYIETIRGTFEQWLDIEDETADSASAMCDLRDDWLDDYPDEKEWFEIGVARFEHQVRIYVADMFGSTYVLANTRNIYTPREHDMTARYDAYELLCKLEKYLQRVMEKILEDPKTYMDYIEKHYPYECRKGSVSYKDWCDIMEEKLVKLDATDLDIIKRVTSANLPYYDGPLTLREYMKVWKVAYCGITGSESMRNLPSEEVFERSSKGRKADLEKYDLDSEEHFMLWAKENAAYHCFDVSYVTIHLLPAPKAGRWRPYLTAAHEWAIDDLFNAAQALAAEGIPFSMPQARDILRMHEMNGRIIIDPDYADRSRIGEIVRRLPEPGYAGVKKEHVNELIKAIKWDPMQEVKLIKKT